MAENQLTRKVGILLVLSPFANFFYSTYLQQRNFLDTAKSITVVNWILWAAALGAGLMMVKGKQKSWLFAFFLMAINVLYGVFTFKKNLVFGWFQPTASLLVNIGFLLFIYRLEFHGGQSVSLPQTSFVEEPPAEQSEPSFPPELKLASDNVVPIKVPHEKFNVQITKNIHVNFAEIGAWAQIVEVSETGMVVRLFDEPSFDHFHEAIRTQTLELVLAPELIVSLRCYDVFDDFYEFHFIHTSSHQLEQIHQWAAA